jgi:hypothetical protein
MLGFSLFKTAKYKQFDFNPRYYDERKERREELIRQLEEEDRQKQTGSVGEYKSHLKSGYLTSYRKKTQKKDGKNSMVRLAIILTLLMAIFYWLLR